MLVAAIVVYSSLACPYCDYAKELLDSKGLEYKEINVDKDPSKLAEMVKKSGRRTVPQIFIDGEHVGGFDDLRKLSESGKLDALIRK